MKNHKVNVLSLSSLAEYLLLNTLCLLPVLYRHRRKLAKFPSPTRRQKIFSSLWGIRKQDGFMVSGCFEQKLAKWKQIVSVQIVTSANV